MNGNPYYVHPMQNYGPALQGLAGQVGEYGKQKKAEERFAQTKAAMEAAYSSGDPDQVARLAIDYPESQQAIQMLFGLTDDKKKREAIDFSRSVLTENDPERISQLYRERIDRLESEGRDPSDTISSYRSWINNPQGERKSLEMIYASQAPKQEWEAYKGGDASSLPAETVAFNELIKDFTPEQQKTAKLVKAGLKGRAVSNAELSAIESGDIKDYADWKAQMKQQQKFAEMTGSSRAKAIDKGFETIEKIDSGIGNIDRAIAAIDNGAGVGAVEKLWPSIKAASVELDNIRGSMALDVVGATTFGALSKGELDLAKDVALPTGLNSAELKDYLIRRKNAQNKLRAYYNEQIQFLDQGGTVAGFLRKKERGQQGKPDNAAPEGNQEPQQLSDEELLNKYL